MLKPFTFCVLAPRSGESANFYFKTGGVDDEESSRWKLGKSKAGAPVRKVVKGEENNRFGALLKKRETAKFHLNTNAVATRKQETTDEASRRRANC